MFQAVNHLSLKKTLLIAAIVLVCTIQPAAAMQIPTFDCSAQTDLEPNECLALIALYTSTNDLSTPNAWINESGWLLDANPCTWFGVTCDSGHLTGLSLVSNNLSGPLPPEIGDFPYLATLELDDNALNGSVPPALKKLANLTHLDLSGNAFTGSLPQRLGNLSLLDSLNLGSNSITGKIPTSFANLVKLTFIDTTGNDLCIPNDIGTQAWYYNPALVKADSLPNCVIPPTPTATELPITNTPTRIPLPTLTYTPTNTATATASPTMLGPFQTLTALAEKETLTATANWTASATEPLPTETLPPEDLKTETAPAIVSQKNNGPPGPISPFWWGVFALAIVLISTGIFMELKRQKKPSKS
ncbi:MAG: hypothetical protein ABFS17_01360 [Chloroflexota bacterium]